MDETAFHGAQKRIDFLGRWALALFTVATVLASWLGARYEAGQFGILFDSVWLVPRLSPLSVAASLPPRICSSNEWRNTKMSEETFALAGLILVATLLCGVGALVLFLPQIDRLVEWWKKKRA